MLDLIIRGATIVDGTGAPGRAGDVGVQDGRIVAVAGRRPDGIADAARDTLDAAGLVVAPGFVDPHTHYDAQLFWDPLATPSNVHGVTTSSAATAASPSPRSHAERRRLPAPHDGQGRGHAAGRPGERASTGAGRPSPSTSTASTARIGVNAGFMVGHCALRRYVMGADAVGNEATPEQLDAMVAPAARVDRGRRPRASRPRCRRPTPTATASRWRRATPAATSSSPCAGRWASTRARPSRAPSRAASTSSATTRSSWSPRCRPPPAGRSTGTCSPSTRPCPTGCPASWRRPTGAASEGGRVVALTMPVLVPMNMSFGTFCALCLIPGLGRRPAAAAGREAGGPRRPRRPAPAGRARRTARRPACSAAWPTGTATSSATRTPPPTRA